MLPRHVFRSLSASATLTHPADEEILAIHQADRRAHFAGDATMLIEHSAPEILSVKDGKITRQSRDDIRKQFEEYFRGSKYSGLG